MTRRPARPGEEARAPLQHDIGLRFKHFGDFVDETATNVSTGGMFISTPRPQPVGSVFEFVLRLGSERHPIAGKAEVVWVRRRGDYLDKPVGMGVRFVELANESRRHIAEIVATHHEQRAGLEGVDAAAEMPPADTGPGPDPPVVDEAPDGPAAESTPRPAPRREAVEAAGFSPSRLPWILLSAVLAAALVVSLWPRPTSPPPPAAEREPAEAAPAGALSAAPTQPDAAAVAEPEPIRIINGWAGAWSEKRVDDYLGAYSPRFTPPGGLDRAAWERQRRERILAPRWIEVSLAFVELEDTAPDRARIRFVQSYESDSYRDLVRKVLELERGERGWRILSETTAR